MKWRARVPHTDPEIEKENANNRPEGWFAWRHFFVLWSKHLKFNWNSIKVYLIFFKLINLIEWQSVAVSSKNGEITAWSFDEVSIFATLFDSLSLYKNSRMCFAYKRIHWPHFHLPKRVQRSMNAWKKYANNACIVCTQCKAPQHSCRQIVQ